MNFLLTLDPIQGSEIGKTRPAVVISNDINNELVGKIPDAILNEIEKALKIHLEL